jgi:hypothetical protein
VATENNFFLNFYGFCLFSPFSFVWVNLSRKIFATDKKTFNSMQVGHAILLQVDNFNGTKQCIMTNVWSLFSRCLFLVMITFGRRSNIMTPTFAKQTKNKTNTNTNRKQQIFWFRKKAVLCIEAFLSLISIYSSLLFSEVNICFGTNKVRRVIFG